MPRHKPKPDGTVYLLHFSTSFHHARHYLGWTSLPVEERLEQHRSGHGARLLEVVTANGISFSVARTWTGTRRLERSLKNHHNARRHCPMCKKTNQ
jgi:predicted GIY-YIG superfamily endonuclease